MTQRMALGVPLLGAIVMLAGCTAPEATNPTAPDAANPPAASGLAQRVSFGQVEMELPENWGVYADGNSAVVGILAGGNCDIPLRVEIHYQQDIESLVPTCCPQHAPPVAVKSVRTIESGFQPVGDRTAQFRRFTATCADLTIERRAWLLPDAKVAIVEQQPSPEIDLVVRQMQVGTLKDVVFENVTFHLPPRWTIAVDGETAIVGMLPVGERDSQLVLTKNFTQSIDDLAPKADCDGGEVVAIDSGFRQLDGATADYREFVVSCPTGRADAHRAWVLPDSNIAIFEDRASPDVDEVDHVVTNATVR
jgi:hypothetical protein